MADVSPWERHLIDRFVLRSKRERYLELLKGPKHRQKILERLNHAFDYDPAYATLLDAACKTEQGLRDLLRRRHVADTCWLMADGNAHDGHELRLEHGITELLRNHWGAVLLCPPKPIAVYKTEDPADVFLLERPAP